jgi:hypothetical protein
MSEEDNVNAVVFTNIERSTPIADVRLRSVAPAVIDPDAPPGRGEKRMYSAVSRSVSTADV